MDKQSLATSAGLFLCPSLHIASIYLHTYQTLQNVGNGRGSSKFHFQRDWKAISDGNSISNVIGSPLCGRNSISNAVGSPLRGRNSISNAPIAWTQFHFQRDWKAISDGNSISNAVGSLLRGRNGISNVFERLAGLS